jgi:hypothetical protein
MTPKKYIPETFCVQEKLCCYSASSNIPETFCVLLAGQSHSKLFPFT